MEIRQRGDLWRTMIGGFIGAVGATALAFYGQAFIYANDPAQYYYQYFFGRIPWLLLMGVALAFIANLATVYLDYRQEPLPIIVRIGAIGMGVAIVAATVQQLLFQHAPFLFDFFLILVTNVGWFLMVAIVPFLLTTIILQFILGFTRRSRSARDIMPPELLAQLDQHQGKRRE